MRTFFYLVIEKIKRFTYFSKLQHALFLLPKNELFWPAFVLLLPLPAVQYWNAYFMAAVPGYSLIQLEYCQR